MTDTLGRRIALHRRRAGIRSTRELSERLAGRISESVLQNIESGRRTDISISQLLDIARAVHVPPVVLLVNVESPFSEVDLPDLGAQFEGVLNWQFDDWFSAVGNPTVRDLGSYEAFDTQLRLRQIRDLVAEVNEWIADEELVETQVAGDYLRLRHRQRQERIDLLIEHLAQRGVNFEWQRPWVDGS